MLSLKIFIKLTQYFYCYLWTVNSLLVEFKFTIKTPKLLHLLAINPFLSNVPILYALDTPENQRSSGVFRVYKTGTFAWHGSRLLLPSYGNQPIDLHLTDLFLNGREHEPKTNWRMSTSYASHKIYLILYSKNLLAHWIHVQNLK